MSNVDEFHIHEALHVSLLIAELVEKELVNHPAIKSDKELLSLAASANDCLLKIYQNL